MRVALLPRGLQRAEHPAEALFQQGADRVRRLGVGEGAVLVHHVVSLPQDRHREVGVLGQRIGGEPARREHELAPPCADGAWDDGDAVEQIERAPIEVLAGDVLERLPAREEVDAVPDLRVAGDGADARIRERGREHSHGVRLEERVGVERDDDIARPSDGARS